MAGKKGKSGRKPKWYEEKYAVLEGLCVDRAIDIMELDTANPTEALNGLDLIAAIKMKDKVMLEVIGKGLPQRMKVEGEIEHKHKHENFYKLSEDELDREKETILSRIKTKHQASSN